MKQIKLSGRELAILRSIDYANGSTGNEIRERTAIEGGDVADTLNALGREDRDMGSRQKAPVLIGIAVDRVVEEVAADSAIVQERVAFARRAISLVWEATHIDLQAEFLGDLARACSWRSGRTGADIYRELPVVPEGALPPLAAPTSTSETAA